MLFYFFQAFTTVYDYLVFLFSFLIISPLEYNLHESKDNFKSKERLYLKHYGPKYVERHYVSFYIFREETV